MACSRARGVHAPYRVGSRAHPTLPVEDFEHIEERRASMGLEPFDEYRKNFEK